MKLYNMQEMLEMLIGRSLTRRELLWGTVGSGAVVLATQGFRPLGGRPAQAAAPPMALRIDAGATAQRVDSQGNTWTADMGFLDGQIVDRGSRTITNTSDPFIYLTERYNVSGYRLSVPNGSYVVKLHFCETYWTQAGQRVFSVNVEGTSITDLDVFVAAGGAYRALIKTIPVTIIDGQLSIAFTPKVNFPFINGIEVLPPMELRIDAGAAAAHVDSHGNTWEPDQDFVGGTTVDRGLISIANTDTPELYRTERYNMTAYTFQVPNGQWMVRMHFCETYWTQAGQRVFNVAVEGSPAGGPVIADLDVFAQAGGARRALVKEVSVSVTQGELNVTFLSKVNYAQINAIELIPVPPPEAIRIDAGAAAAHVDSHGNTWEPDQDFVGGTTVDRGLISIANTDTPELYRTERYNMTAYTFQVPNGQWMVRMHFCETYWTQAGQRVFNVAVEGSPAGGPVIADLDVFAQAGGARRALVKEVSVSVTQEELNISFSPKTNFAMINALELIPAPALPTRYLHAEGNKLFTALQQEVRLTCINWFGAEGRDRVPNGLWARRLDDLVDVIDSSGFNCVRLPFSGSILDSTPPGSIDFNINPELRGLSALQVMDRVVDALGRRGLHVILDRHRLAAGYGNYDLWYDATVPESRWIDDWVTLARHYAGNDVVIGADLHNEPWGRATWGDGSPTDWRAAAERAGNAILAVQPNWLIIVEGIETYGGRTDWWGGNLIGARQYSVRLSRPSQLVYSAHDYSLGVGDKPWFHAPDYPNNLPGVWQLFWAYLHSEAIAPVWVGEFGGRSLGNDIEGVWQRALVDYLRQQGIHYAYWCLNPNSSDTGGLLMDDWRTINQEKLQLLRSYQWPKW